MQAITGIEMNHPDDVADYENAKILLKKIVDRNLPSKFTFKDAKNPSIKFQNCELIVKLVEVNNHASI